MALTYEQLRSNAERIADAQIKERVLRGIEVLNAFDPDWADYIDPGELMLDNTRQCILGQVFDRHVATEEQWDKLRDTNPLAVIDDSPGIEGAGFTKGLAILNGEVAEEPGAFGFDTLTENYSDLTYAWLTALGEEDGTLDAGLDQ